MNLNQDNILDNTLNTFFGTTNIPLSNPIVEDVEEEEDVQLPTAEEQLPSAQQDPQTIEEEEEDYSDMPPLIPLRDRTNELTLWRDLVEDYQNNIREYQRNMDNILRITESVLLRENMNNVVYRPRPTYAEIASRSSVRPSSNSRTTSTPITTGRTSGASISSASSGRTSGAFEGRTSGAFEGRTSGAFEGRTSGAFEGRTSGASSTSRSSGNVRQTSSSSSVSNSPLIQSLLRTFMTPSTTSQLSSSSILRSLLDQRNTPITLMDFEIDGITIPISFSASTANTAPTREIINNATETFVYSSSNNDNTTCPITLESFIEGETICKIKHCGHVFKDDALKRWFTRNPYCPSCRYDIRDYEA